MNKFNFIKKVFLATPITPLLDEDNMMEKEAKSSIQAILKDLRSEVTSDVFCAIEREEWGEKLMDGKTCTSLDLAGIRASDFVIAFADSSFGVHMELGWASALGKPIIILINSEVGVKTPLVEGLGTITFAQILYYKSKKTLPSSEQWNLYVKHDVLNAIRKLAIEVEINNQKTLFECGNISSNKLNFEENNIQSFLVNQKKNSELMSSELSC